MCLVVVALEVTREWPFVLAANRDERHARPAVPAAWWRDRPDMLAGRDLTAGGTWLAVDRRGRAAAVTNLRDGPSGLAPRSRGQLVAEFVGGDAPAADYARAVAAEGGEFGAFNLLAFDGRELHYTSNRAPAASLGPGVHAFSNSPPGTDWPKVATARAGVRRLLDAADPVDGLLGLLAERGSGAPQHLYRSAHFIVGEGYGTRCSTVLLVDAAGNALFAERSFDAIGEPSGEVRAAFALRRQP